MVKIADQEYKESIIAVLENRRKTNSGEGAELIKGIQDKIKNGDRLTLDESRIVATAITLN
jgi:uncharacterized coiled-coil DUF342 family protein